MPLDPEVAAWLAEAPLGPALEEMTVEDARRQMVETSRLLRAQRSVERVEEMHAEGPAGRIPLRCYVTGTTPRPVIVFFHGGGWVMGSIETHDAFCHDLASACGANVASVEYRLAPEAPFPAAAQDAYAAAAWIADRLDQFHGTSNRLIVAGDSAGGNLAAVASLVARDRQGPPIAGQVLIYPITDHDFETPSYRQNADGYHLTRNAMIWFWDHYLADPQQRNDPLASPSKASSLSCLPPTLVLTAQYDPLRDEGHDYAQRLQAAGNRVQRRNYDGTIHGFIRRLPWTRTREAMRDIADFVADCGK